MLHTMNSAAGSALQVTTTDAEPRAPKKIVQDALYANKRLQQVLTQRAEQLEPKLKATGDLLEAANSYEGEDDPESEVLIPGAKKAASLFLPSEFLNPSSPFQEEATKRSNYIANTRPHPMKLKDLETLAAAVRQENERLQAYRWSQSQDPSAGLDGPIDLENNIEGLDWTRIAEKVSDSSSVKRTPTECRVVWIGNRHPRINHAEWSASEVDKLNAIVLEYSKNPVDWVRVAETLGTNRTPIDCMRHGLPQHRHNWAADADQKLIKAVQSCGIDNWQLVAKKVSEFATAGQCQGRWQKSLNPAIKRGAWTAEEDELLRKAVVGYGNSWVQVATAIPGRTNDQCRERWIEHVNPSIANITWSDAEDKSLLQLVESLGNKWTAISSRIGNNKTGQNCRLRHEKLKRTQKLKSPINSTPRIPSSWAGAATAPSNIAGPSQLVQNPEQGSSTFTFDTNLRPELFSRPSETALTIPVSIDKPRPKPRAKRKGNAKESVPEGDSHSLQTLLSEQADASRTPLAQSNPVEETRPGHKKTRMKATAVSEPHLTIPQTLEVVAPKPRPKPRPKVSKKAETAINLLETPVAHADSSVVPSPAENLSVPAPQPTQASMDRTDGEINPDVSDAALAPAEIVFTHAHAILFPEPVQPPVSIRELKRKAKDPAEGDTIPDHSNAGLATAEIVSTLGIPTPVPTQATPSTRGRKRKAADNAEGETNQSVPKKTSTAYESKRGRKRASCADRGTNPDDSSGAPEAPSTLSSPEVPTSEPTKVPTTRGKKRKSTGDAEGEKNQSAPKKPRTRKAKAGSSKDSTVDKFSPEIVAVAPTSEPVAPTQVTFTTESSTYPEIAPNANLDPASSPQLRRGRSSKINPPPDNTYSASTIQPSAVYPVTIKASSKRSRGRPCKAQAEVEPNS